MLGFAPLAAAPLAALLSAGTVGGATHEITATASITFGGVSTLTAEREAQTIHVEASGRSTINFGTTARLVLAGRPVIFRAIPRNFVFRGIR